MNKHGLFLAAGLLLFASAAMAGGAKVEICHIPPGNPANAHTIDVSENALPAHLAHGDYELDATGICCAVYPRCLWNARNCAEVTCPDACLAACGSDRNCYAECVSNCPQRCRAFLRQCVEANCP